MDSYEKEYRQSLGSTNLICIARQNVYELLQLINTEMGYTLASKSNNGALLNFPEYPEYKEFLEPLKLVVEYLAENSFNSRRLREIADMFPKTYFHDLVYNGLVCQ